VTKSAPTWKTARRVQSIVDELLQRSSSTRVGLDAIGHVKRLGEEALNRDIGELWACEPGDGQDCATLAGSETGVTTVSVWSGCNRG